ncbi:hypothetical protein [Bordetella sp. 02P26C-1]|uniref:hypothetical protein n=1 Tax=Bordetella sp. 02P26C-1 TaxID=2683195 RepID=UPI001353437F|nr:hypothetical protein [Bordetella sp. 02P26C-1]MVW79348.1 hypothetical protein [Bordetella sp. 02P26C-1]
MLSNFNQTANAAVAVLESVAPPDRPPKLARPAHDPGGLGMGMPMVTAASGSNSFLTYSAISAGEIFMRHEATRPELSSTTATEAIA